MKWSGKYGLTLKAMLLVLPLVGLKAILHFSSLEVISVGPVITALIAGVFFVIAIILSGVMADFKESEKVPSELAAAIEALHKDTRLLGVNNDSREMSLLVGNLLHVVISNFNKKGRWSVSEVNAAIDAIDEDIVAQAVKGSAPAILLKLRTELGNVKRLSNRIEVIKEVTFLPAGHAIAEFSTGVALLVLLLLKLDPFYEGYS